MLVVEHDEDTMMAADCIVDIGPGAGEHGGNVVAVGTAKQIMKCKDSITGAYLSGRIQIPVPKELSLIHILSCKSPNGSSGCKRRHPRRTAYYS